MLSVIRTLLCVLALAMLPGCDSGQATVFSGYSYGEFIYLSFPDTANIESVYVNKGDRVHAGQKLAKIESFSAENVLQRAEQKYQAEAASLRNLESGERQEKLNVVRAQLERARSAASQAKRQMERYKTLYATRGVSALEWENAKDDYVQKSAQLRELEHQLKAKQLPARQAEISNQTSLLEAARLERDKARWDVQQSTLVAPQNARVYDVLYRPGERPSAGRPVISLLPANNIKIRFFIPEKMLGSIQMGKRVRLSCDGCAEPIPAVINYISPEAEYTPPVIYSTARREKLIFMVEAIPDSKQVSHIKIGQPFDVEILADE